MSSNGDQSDSRSPTASIRGGSTSVRGRGGFVPKKLLAQMQSMELSSSDSSNVIKEKFQILAAENSESDTDSETEPKKKRCDFCGDTNHQNRSCPLLQDNFLSLDEQGKNINKPNTCFHCKQEGHFKADCPKLGVLLRTCHYCKKRGHMKADCLEKAAREAKKRERERTLNYTFRKTSQKETSTSPLLSTNTMVDVFYEGPTKEEEKARDVIESTKAPRVIVPLTVKASQLKSEVKLRAKLGSSGSDHSVSRKIVRSESSEEEERESMKSDDENSKENNLVKDQKIDERANEDEEFQTIGIKIDGCVEFDSGDDRSYYDVSDGEQNGDGDRRKRISEEPDELYGEDGALIYNDEKPSNIEEDANMEEKEKNNDEGKKEEQIVGEQE